MVARWHPSTAEPDDREKLAQNGMLFAAGLITGEALVGIFIAICIWISKNPDVLTLGVNCRPRNGSPRYCCLAFAIGFSAPGRRAAPRNLRDSRQSTKLVLCLATVYLVWGSAFLFTKIAVSNLPPALFAGVRFMTAGTLLTFIAWVWGGDKLPRRPIEWRHVIIAGFFMVFVSNGLNTWSMQYMPSNQSALLNGTSAFWIAGFGVFGRRGHP